MIKGGLNVNKSLFTLALLVAASRKKPTAINQTGFIIGNIFILAKSEIKDGR